jgi:hypothetical protein
MSENRTKRFELVELTVPANAGAGSRVAFNTIPQLRNQANQTITIKDICIYLDTAYAFSQVTNSVIGMAATEIPKCVLVLYVNGEESIKMIPLAELNHIQDATANPFQQNWYPFADLENVDWDKSYVQFNSAGAGTQYVIPFGIRYLRMMKNAANEWVEA